MKRFLSILLAVMLVCAMFPAVSAEVTATEETATERVYAFNTKLINKSDPAVWDKTMTGKYQQSSIFPLKGYGTHGFKYWDIDDTAFANLAKCERSMILSSDYLRFWSGCSDSSHPIKNENGAKLAIALEAPSSVASFYSVTVETNGSDGSSTMSVYMDELDENKKTVEEYTLPENLLDSEYTASSDVKTFNEVIYSDGLSELIIAFGMNPTGRTRLYDATLTPVKATAVAFKSVRSEILPGEELQLTVNATVDSKQRPVSNGFVTYTSSDDDILIVDENGLVKGISDGTATVTATVGDTKITKSITVGNKVYMMYANYVDTTEPGVWDTTIKNYNSYKTTPLPVQGYGSHGWKFFDVDDWTYSKLPSNTRFLHFQPVNLRFFSEYGADATNPDSAKASFDLERPEQNGFYLMKIGVDGGDGAGDLTPYMSYVDETKTTVEEYAIPQYMINNTYNTKSSTGMIASKLIYADGENDLMIALTLVGRTRLMSLTLIPQKKITDIALNAPETVLLGNSAVAKVNGAGSSLEVGNGFVTYESSNKAAATIDKCGNITTVAPGKTTITATVGNLSKSVEIEVIKEDEELTNAFDATEEEFTSAPLTTATVNTFTAKMGESKTSESAVIESKSAALGESFTVTAPDAEEGYKFLYWAKGMSTDKKQIVSYNESYSFIPTVENTYLIAVYEAVNGESAADKAEFYNANGQLIETLTENGTAPALPEMAGYNAALGWALYGTNDVIVAGADVEVEGIKVYVAKFGNPKPVKVNETEVAYGDKVSFKASPASGEIFKCWKKDGVIVSTDETYEFFAWKDATVEAVYVTEEFTFSGIARKILIDTFATGGKSSVMAEFIGFEDAVEKGIMLGTKRFAMTTDASQFTLVNDIDATEVTGYAIFKDGTIVFDK